MSEESEFAAKRARKAEEPSGMSLVLLVQRLSAHAQLPQRQSALAAGYDLFSAHDVVIPAQGKAIVPTDIAIALPEGCYGRVAPRSGLAWKNHLDVAAGVIDADYRGNVGVVLFNHAQSEFQVKRGDRVAQLILERILTPDVQEMTALPDTARGVAGFGSTGVSAPASSAPVAEAAQPAATSSS
eukprot:m.17401 g.17401  ORF g.17401 m.17401 type:complete len:184 (+) comp29201_c0_seq1:40-591(+)